MMEVVWPFTVPPMNPVCGGVRTHIHNIQHTHTHCGLRIHTHDENTIDYMHIHTQTFNTHTHTQKYAQVEPVSWVMLPKILIRESQHIVCAQVCMCVCEYVCSFALVQCGVCVMFVLCACVSVPEHARLGRG